MERNEIIDLLKKCQLLESKNNTKALAHTYELLGNLYLKIDQISDVVLYYTQALELHETHQDGDKQMKVCMILGNICAQYERDKQAIGYFERIVEESGKDIERWKAEYNLALLYRSCKDVDKCIMITNLLVKQESLPEVDLKLYISIQYCKNINLKLDLLTLITDLVHGSCLNAVGQYEEALEVVLSTISSAEELIPDHSNLQLSLRTLAGIICIQLVRYEEAIEQFSVCQRLATNADLWRDEALAEHHLAQTFKCLEKSEEASIHVHRAIELAKAHNDTSLEVMFSCTKCSLNLDFELCAVPAQVSNAMQANNNISASTFAYVNGNTEEALEQATAVVRWAQKAQDTNSELHAQRLVGFFLLQQGKLLPALQALQHCLDLISTPSKEFISLYGDLGSVFEMLYKKENKEEHASAALENYEKLFQAGEEFHQSVSQIRALRGQARMLLSTGRTRDGLASFEKALALSVEENNTVNIKSISIELADALGMEISLLSSMGNIHASTISTLNQKRTTVIQNYKMNVERENSNGKEHSEMKFPVHSILIDGERASTSILFDE